MSDRSVSDAPPETTPDGRRPLRIAYVANHGCGGTDDEGAIAHALRVLRHEVTCYRERDGRSAAACGRHDLVLFHKWDDFSAMAESRTPLAFWYFDLVEHSDPLLARRCEARRTFLTKASRLAQVGFCTDGDWAANGNNAHKLVWLTQGADERFVARPESLQTECHNRLLLFTGISRGGGAGRESWVTEMTSRYPRTFRHIGRGVYQRDLADMIAASAAVVAPDSPASDRYWSNRVYVASGFGGFVLHPYCSGLASHYRDREEIVFYVDRGELHSLIEYYLELPAARHDIARAALERTLANHLYLHRCQTLVGEVRNRLGI